MKQHPVTTSINNEPTDPLIGTVIAGRYEIQSLVGRGGMSVVYKARNKAVGSTVAIKTLKEDLLSDEELFARFCQEGKAVQMLRHPNIITVHEFGVTMDGQPFMAMDYLEGETLSDVLTLRGRIGVKRCLRIFSQVCEALAHAHQHNIIHRDIKPGNIMLVETANETDFVKVFDFGFAKFLERPGKRVQALTQVGDVLGTPLYMSPEQSAGKKLDSRSDIYSVGCVMYEALTGKAPLIGENVLDTMQKQINEKPQSLDAARPDLFIPEPMTTILFRTLEKDPSRRYQSMKDLKRDLEITLMGMSGMSVGENNLPGLAKLKELPEQREFVIDPTAAGLAVAVLVVGALGWTSIAFMNRSAEQTVAEQTVVTEAPIGATTTTSPTAPAVPPIVFGPLPSDPQKLLQLGRTYLRQRALPEAEKAAVKAIAVLKEKGHTNDKIAAEAFALNGEVYLSMENFKKADVMFKKALAIQQRELGPTHVDVIASINGLARAAEGQGDFARADAYYKQALATQSVR